MGPGWGRWRLLAVQGLREAQGPWSVGAGCVVVAGRRRALQMSSGFPAAGDLARDS